MNPKLFSVIIFSIVLFGCEKINLGRNPDTHSYKYSVLSKIEMTYDTVVQEFTLSDTTFVDTAVFVNSKVIAGDNYVFKYRYTYGDRPDYIDDEYTEFFLIEVPVNEDTFYYESEGLNDLNSAFSYLCYCPRLGLIKADSGTVSGVKIDENSWRLDINARFTGKQDGNPNLFQKTYAISKIFKAE